MILWVFCAPAYVDPSSGYRYYSLQQIPVVDAIQLCVDLDIPLKQFTDYCMDGGSRIHYGKLIERGTILAKEKIQAIQERRKFKPYKSGWLSWTKCALKSNAAS